MKKHYGLKGALWGFIFLIIISICAFIISMISPGSYDLGTDVYTEKFINIFFPGGNTVQKFFCPPGTHGEFCGLLQLPAFYLISYIIIGVIFGLIIGKIKSRKQQPSQVVCMICYMNIFKKIIGLLLVLITVIWSWYLLWSGFYQSIAFPRAGYPVLSVFLAVLLLILVLPVGVSYIFNKNELLKAGRVAIWFHFSSIIVLILGFLPYLPCILNRSNCDKGGVGEMILFAISALVAGALYTAGLVALSINKGSRISSSSPTDSPSPENG